MGRSAPEKGGNVLEGQTEMRRTIMEKLRSGKMEERGKGRVKNCICVGKKSSEKHSTSS